MSETELPDKLYFKIGEVAKLVGVKPYVLRYWETEFSVVRPGKTRSHHRLYRRRDVETLLEIRRLLYGERYTIEGAKQVIAAYSPDSGSGEQLELIQEGEGPAASSASEPSPRGGDNRLRTDMIEIKKFLEELLVRMA